ncbi:MAG: hypothetical protein ACRCV9_17625 [Burkholderiaceae bacterium]
MDTDIMPADPIKRAIAVLGLRGLAAKVGLSYKAVTYWRDQGYLPRTEWTGETNYAETIERETGGQVTAAELLAIRPKQQDKQSA